MELWIFSSCNWPSLASVILEGPGEERAQIPASKHQTITLGGRDKPEGRGANFFPEVKKSRGVRRSFLSWQIQLILELLEKRVIYFP